VDLNKNKVVVNIPKER